jgi:hypothetical protein
MAHHLPYSVGDGTSTTITHHPGRAGLTPAPGDQPDAGRPDAGRTGRQADAGRPEAGGPESKARSARNVRGRPIRTPAP